MHWTFHLHGIPNCSALAVVGDKLYCFEQYSRGVFPKRRPIGVHILNAVNYAYVGFVLPKHGEVQFKIAPSQRHGHSAASHGTNIYIWGGRNERGSCERLYCFDTETLHWSRPEVKGRLPKGRLGHTASVIGDCMYIYGGLEFHSRRFSQDVFMLNLVLMEWKYITVQGEPPCPFSSTSVFGHRIYMFCSCENIYALRHGASSGMHYLDTQTQKWNKCFSPSIIPVTIKCRSTFVHRQYIYVCGEFDNLYGSELYRFCPETNEWTVIKTQGNSNFTNALLCAEVGDKIFFFGPRNDLHVLDFSPSLRSICIQVVLENNLDDYFLPETLRQELRALRCSPPDETNIQLDCSEERRIILV